MSIHHAILGLLSWKPASGYELKKIFEQSSALYWSGNNNQIYKSLVQLLDEGLVTHEIRHQERSPAKKIYSITPQGLASLREWVLSPPEPPEFRKPFLIQLAWADLLSDEELDGLLAAYEGELRDQLLLRQEEASRGAAAPDRSPREAMLWRKIEENLLTSYSRELEWVQELRTELAAWKTEGGKRNDDQ